MEYKSKIYQHDVDINNSLDFFFYFNRLIDNKQLTQWINLVQHDLKKQSIVFGQPLGFFLLIEYSNLIINSEDIFLLSSNFLERIKMFDKELCNEPSKFISYDNSEILLLINQLEINLLDFSIVEQLFHKYLNYCLYFNSNITPFIGVWKQWIIK